MFTRDYIIRVIEQAAAFLARALKLERAGQYEAGLREVETAYEALLDMDRSGKVLNLERVFVRLVCG